VVAARGQFAKKREGGGSLWGWGGLDKYLMIKGNMSKGLILFTEILRGNRKAGGEEGGGSLSHLKGRKRIVVPKQGRSRQNNRLLVRMGRRREERNIKGGPLRVKNLFGRVWANR